MLFLIVGMDGTLAIKRWLNLPPDILVRASAKESLTAENCTAIIIGAAALIGAHVTFCPPLLLGRMGHCATYRLKPKSPFPATSLYDHFPQWSKNGVTKKKGTNDSEY